MADEGDRASKYQADLIRDALAARIAAKMSELTHCLDCGAELVTRHLAAPEADRCLECQEDYDKYVRLRQERGLPWRTR